MTLKNRLSKLEKCAAEQRAPHMPQNVYIYGTRNNGETYLVETWRQLIEADTVRYEVTKHEQH